MRTVITGGAGFLGSSLVSELLHAPGTAADPPEARQVVVADRPGSVVAQRVDDRVDVVEVDLTGPTEQLEELVAGADAVVHLASIVSADAEAAPDRAWALNVEASRRLLAACGRRAPGCRFLTTSSVAVFDHGRSPGGSPAGEATKHRPASTYGMTKAILELLVNEATRRGEVDGRIARLPTVVVRPGRPNLAASSFASGVFREPLAGIDCVVPVRPDVVLVLIGRRSAVRGMASLLALPADRLGAERGVNLPGLCASVEDMITTCTDVAARHGLLAGAISVAPDPAIEAIVASWPSTWDATRAIELGLPRDASLADIVEEHLAERSAG
jgi:nucleoside-diphosphate-sugar epimerase